MRSRWTCHQADATEMEVLFKAIELEKIGDFECADVAPSVPDFFLEIAHDANQIVQGEARPEELIPESLSVKAQAQVLAGELVIKLMGVRNGLRIERE